MGKRFGTRTHEPHVDGWVLEVGYRKEDGGEESKEVTGWVAGYDDYFVVEAVVDEALVLREKVGGRNAERECGNLAELVDECDSLLSTPMKPGAFVVREEHL